MRSSIALLICALAIPVCGCSNPKEEVVPVGTQTNWDEKFAAANSIQKAETKDAAMADLAKQAGIKVSF